MSLPAGYREAERDFWPLDTDSVGTDSQVRRLRKTVLDSVRGSSIRECLPAEAYTSRLLQAWKILDEIMDDLSLYWHDRPPERFWSPLSLSDLGAAGEWNGPSPVDVGSLDRAAARYLQAEWMQTNLVEWYLLNGFIFDSLARTREAFLSGTAIGRINWAYILSRGKSGRAVLLRIGLNVVAFILRWVLCPVAAVLLFLAGRTWLALWVGILWLSYALLQLILLPRTLRGRRQVLAESRRLETILEGLAAVYQTVRGSSFNPERLRDQIREVEGSATFVQPVVHSLIARAIQRDPAVFTR